VRALAGSLLLRRPEQQSAVFVAALLELRVVLDRHLRQVVERLSVPCLDLRRRRVRASRDVAQRERRALSRVRQPDQRVDAKRVPAQAPVEAIHDPAPVRVAHSRTAR
jgi:hypothetical protein